MNPLWSYTLGGLGVLGIYLAGSKRTVGWAISLAAQPLWMAYAVVTEQWGFLVTPVLYGSVYARNLWAWHKNPPASDDRGAVADNNS
jgi:hypothetical protein